MLPTMREMERFNGHSSKETRARATARLWVIFWVAAVVVVFSGFSIFSPDASHDSVWVHGIFLGGLMLLLLSTIRLVVDSTNLDESREVSIRQYVDQSSSD